jgi:hypothetical protein
MALIKRLDIGRPITAAEMDANLQYLEDSISAGTSGTSGVSGSTGISGSSGSSGTSGVSGSPGVSGTSGSSGTSGAGTSGSSGTSGAGTSGSSGTSGAGTSGSSGTSGTSLALSLFDGDLTRLSGIRNITLSGLSLSPSGSGGATITNLGGGGGGSTINVQSGSTTISSVSTLRVDASTMSLTNNGGGTVTIGVSGSLGGGVAGTNGTSGTNGSSGTSISLTLRKDALTLDSIRNITLSGSIFLDVSGSGGALLRVEGGGIPVVLNGVVSSSQQIVGYDTFAVKNSANSFNGNQTVTGSITSTTTITAADLYVGGVSNIGIPEGNLLIGGSGSRSTFLPTSSLTATAAITVFDGTGVPFSNISTITFSNDFDVNASGSGAITVLSLAGGGVASSGSGFPFTGSAIITGSLGITGPVVISGSLTNTGAVTASAFAITSVGTPTIESATNINLTAGGSVLITTSSLRLASFSDAQTSSLTAVNGDMIYNSTTHKFMGYASGSWVQLH